MTTRSRLRSPTKSSAPRRGTSPSIERPRAPFVSQRDGRETSASYGSARLWRDGLKEGAEHGQG
jgi:hypothetical protein